MKSWTFQGVATMSKMTDSNKECLLSFVSGQQFFNSKLKDRIETEQYVHFTHETIL